MKPAAAYATTSVSAVLSRRVFLYYLLFSTLMIAVLAIYAFLNEQKTVEHQITLLNSQHSDEVAERLWQMEINELKPLLQKLVTAPEVSAVEVLDHHREERFVTAGEVNRLVSHLFEQNFRLSFPIYYSHQTGEELVGYVQFYIHWSVVVERIQDFFLMMTTSLLVMMAALWAILVFSSRKLIEKPLARLVQMTGEVDLAKIEQFGIVELSTKANEIQRLESSYANMLRRLDLSAQQLVAANLTLEKKVELRTDELKKASLAKDDFLASMSHELRTPLTSIIGNSEFLSEQVDDTDLAEIIHSIELAGRRQLALVNDILDMSKIESGKFTIDKAPYDFEVLIRDIERMLTVRAQDAGLKMVVEQKNREDHLLIGDGHRIGQILINLIGNSIKFTDKGEVKLTTWVDNGYLILQVRDSGIGMPPEIVDNLFQRFEQADGTINRRFGGSGLGLYISENLADLMGGWIDVSSIKGEGSSFQVVLPYQPSDQPIVKSRQDAEMESVLNAKLVGQVLVAEDTSELQLLERRILEGFGLTVTVAGNGREAVDLAEEHPFDLILMDMQMPEIDGIEATKILRSKGNQVPIVALTANVMQKHRDLFDKAGCDGFIAKPIDKSVLRRTISPFLKVEVDKKS